MLAYPFQVWLNHWAYNSGYQTEACRDWSKRSPIPIQLIDQAVGGLENLHFFQLWQGGVLQAPGCDAELLLFDSVYPTCHDICGSIHSSLLL